MHQIVQFTYNSWDIVKHFFRKIKQSRALLCTVIILAFILFPIYTPLLIFILLFACVFTVITLIAVVFIKFNQKIKLIFVEFINFYENIKLRWSKESNKIIRGLKNNSSECYMNSIIQLLASSDEFIKQISSLKTSDPKLTSLLDLLNSVNNPNSEINENSGKVKFLIKNINWQKPSQQDAYDLLSTILNAIYKGIKNHTDSNQIVMPLKLKMMHVFSGINIPNKTQFYLGLSIGLCGDYNKYPGVTLNYLVDQYFAPTIIDDDPNKTSNLLFSGQPPNLLLLHIQANKWSNERREMIKPEYHIQYEKYLEFNAKCYNNEKYEQENVDVRYKLTAIVHHMGTISGGHYVTYRIWKDNWYLINDEEVSPIDFNCEICPYILLYEKV